ncbi:MAG: glycosyltransferase family 9 protein [Bryobacteraceae bacterium]|nr:glycosyltransferase family 9 protein [Bryobacteraceae bacterium]
MLDPASVRRVLAVKLSSMGDVVHATPCLKAIRRRFPRAEILMAVEKRFAAVVRNNPHVDSLIEAPVRDARALSLLRTYARLRLDFMRRRIDLAIDFQGNRKSAVWIYACGARVKAGRGDNRPGWQHAVLPDLNQHAVRVCVAVAAAAGIPVDDPDPEVFVSPEDDDALRAILQSAGVPAEGFVAINPFAAWKSKRWPLERYARLMERIRKEADVPMIVTGGPGEEQQAAELMRMLAPGTATDLTGRLTLDEALCLYRRSRLMVTGDSGPMHVAAALGTPVVALFGPTQPERTGPWGAGHVVIQKMRPLSHHAYRDDPEGAHIRAIGVDDAWEAVFSTLAQRRTQPASELKNGSSGKIVPF